MQAPLGLFPVSRVYLLGWLNLSLCARSACAPVVVVHKVYNSSPVSRACGRKPGKGRENAGAPARGRSARGCCCGPGSAHEQRGVARGGSEADEPMAQRHHSWCGYPCPAMEQLACVLQHKSDAAHCTACRQLASSVDPPKTAPYSLSGMLDASYQTTLMQADAG